MKYLSLITSFLLISSCSTEKSTTLGNWDYRSNEVVLDTRSMINWEFHTRQNSTYEEVLRVKNAKIEVTIIGRIAHYRMFLELHNSYKRNLEGEFAFPLPPGSQINHLAMDIAGEMRQGVIVEKEKGRVVFEEISRQQADPALLEKTDENMYRLRVFPVPSGSSRKVEIGFDQSLDIQGNGLVFWYPYQMCPELSDLKMDIAILGMETPPSLAVPSGIQPYPLAFSKNKIGYTASLELKGNEKASVYFALNPYENYARPVRTALNDQFDLVSFPINHTLLERNRKAPQSIALLWDASSSVSEEQTLRNTAFLKAFIKQHPNAKFSLHVQQFPRSEAVQFPNGEKLLAYLLGLSYDGASVFYPPQLKEEEEIWYFSDGRINLSKFPEIPTIPLYSIASDITANKLFLKELAESSGGKLLVLDQGSPEALVQALLKDQPRLLAVEGVELALLPVGLNHSLSINQWMYLPVPKGSEKCALEIGFKNGEKERIEVAIPKMEIIDLQTCARQWASQRIAHLEATKEKARNKEIRSLSQHYHLVSNTSSLLVLDSLSDYVRFEVEPEEEELKTAYLSLVKQKEDTKAEDQELHDRQVVATYLENRKRYLADYFEETKIEPSEVVATEGSTPEDTLSRVSPLVVPDNLVIADTAYSIQNTIAGSANQTYFFSGSHTLHAYNADANVRISAESWEFGDIEMDQIGLRPTQIRMKPFNPGTAQYLSWKKKKASELYAAYLIEKDLQSSPPAFYLDVSELLIQKGALNEGLRVISNLAEMHVESAELLRILGRRFMKEKKHKEAIFIFERVIEIKGEDPQSYRDLALALEADKRYQESFNTFCFVVHNQWDVRFPEIEQIAIEEAQHVWFLANKKLNTDSLPTLYREIIPKKLRVVIDWDTDLCDIDLWVDQDGSRCYYGNRFEKDGGVLSRDFTGGYGPEVYQIRKAKQGTKEIRINYFGARANKVLGETLIHVKIFKNYGTKHEKASEQTLRLKDVATTVDIAELSF